MIFKVKKQYAILVASVLIFSGCKEDFKGTLLATSAVGIEQPETDKKVYLKRLDAPLEVLSTTTDKNGDFLFTELKKGKYAVFSWRNSNPTPVYRLGSVLKYQKQYWLNTVGGDKQISNAIDSCIAHHDRIGSNFSDSLAITVYTNDWMNLQELMRKAIKNELFLSDGVFTAPCLSYREVNIPSEKPIILK